MGDFAISKWELAVALVRVEVPVERSGVGCRLALPPVEITSVSIHLSEYTKNL
jgi:hypothetical protein